MEEENCLNQVAYPLSKKYEIVQWIVLSILIFLVPGIVPNLLSAIFGANSFIATNSQYIVGTIVNTALIIAAINVKGWKQIVGLITLPSISAISSGLIFKTANIYSVYMVPAIWVGNFMFVYLYRKLFIQKKINYVLSAIASILAKVAIIYLCFRLFTLVTVIPGSGKVFEMMNLSMGLNQAVTATIASILGFGISKIYTKRKQEENK